MSTKYENLFQIGEIAKILGVTRKTILVYEERGLLTPAVKDEATGYRYYTADNMTQIRSIRSLQALGLSLNEIAEYCRARQMRLWEYVEENEGDGFEEVTDDV